MKRIAIVLALLLAVVLGFKAVPVVAESLMVASEKASSITKDQIVDGSAYLVGESIDVQGTVKGDVYCAGQTVTISGTVDGDVLCAGQTVTISGIVHGDVRAAGMTINLQASVDGSVTMAGATITTDSSSKIGRDATITGGTVNLSGSVTRDAVLTGQTVAFNGAVGRDVRVAAETINAATTAKIGGNFFYQSENEAKLPADSVAGKVQRTESRQQNNGISLSVADVLTGLFIAVIMFAVLTVALALVAPRYVHRVSDISGAKQFILYFIVGLVSFITIPILMLVLLLTVIGVYVALVLGLVATLAVMVGAALVAYRLGRFMLNGRQHPLMNALVGSLALGVFCVIPYIGWLVLFVSTLIGFGMVVMGMKSQYPNELPDTAAKKLPRKTKTVS